MLGLLSRVNPRGQVLMDNNTCLARRFENNRGDRVPSARLGARRSRAQTLRSAVGALRGLVVCDLAVPHGRTERCGALCSAGTGFCEK